MSSITVFMKNGEKKEFPHKGRSGGSYTKTISFEGAVAIIEDEWGNRVIIPTENIDHIDEKVERW